MAYKKINNLLSIEESNGTRKFLVDNSWTFEIPSGVVYAVDAELSKKIEAIDLSGAVKPLVLQGEQSKGEYVFNASLQQHFDLFGNYSTVIDCKYDNRANEENDCFKQWILYDKNDFYVDCVVENVWIVGMVIFSIRVRGENCNAFNITAELRHCTQSDVDTVKNMMLKIANTITPYTLGKNTSTAGKKKSDSVISKDFIIQNGILKKYIGKDTSISLPDGIKEIDSNVFSGMTSLRSVYIPEGVEIIGPRAFENCINLENVYLPDSLLGIDSYAFVDCHKLKSVTLGENLKYILGSVFSECFALSDVVIPDGIPVIAAFAFKNCSNFTKLVLPDSVTRIEVCAFSYCSNLEYLYIPSSVTDIAVSFLDETPFQGCERLTVYCPAGSYAEQFCKKHKIRYKIENNPQRQSTVKNKSVTVSRTVVTGVSETDKKEKKKPKTKTEFPEYEVKDSRKKNLLKCKDIKAGINPEGCDIRLKRCYDAYLNEEETEIALVCREAYMNDSQREHLRFLTEKALQYADVFPDDDKYDKKALIKGGYLKTFYQLHILRSFAWTLTKWCRQKKREISDVATEELLALIAFIEERDGANYNSSVAADTDFCASLRPKYEIGKVYTDAAGVLFDEKIVSGDECCVTPDGGSYTPLESLRNDLCILEPAIAKLYDSIKNEPEACDSPAADILFSWCAFAVASREPFAVVKGPKKLDFCKIEGIPERKADMVPEADTDGFVIYKNNLISIKRDKCNKENIVIPEGVTRIFPGTALNDYLRTENYPDFYFMENITRMVIPSTLVNINKIKDGQKTVTELIFNHGVSAIPDSAFSSAGKLRAVTLPETLKSIGEYSFGFCRDLVEITIPQSVEYIHENAFYGVDAFKGPDFYAFKDGKKAFECKLSVYKDSYAATVARERKWYHTVILTKAQKEEEIRKAEAEIRKKEAEEERQRQLQAQYEEIRRREEALRREREEAERKRAEEERRIRRKAEYEALIAEKAEQQKIIAENQGFFKRKTRIAAEEKLAEIEAKIKTYPEFTE